MMGRLARETDEGKKIAVVLDNARFHHAKALNDLYAPGQALERITPIYMPPPYAPDPGTHRTHTGRRQSQHRQPPRALAPQNTLAAFTTYITNRTFDYDFEHLPITPPRTDLV